MNKKGFLLAEETLKVLIAAICIVFLIFLIITVYNFITGEKKTKQAEENLNRIDEIIASLENEESENQDVSNPEGWHLMSFVNEETPKSCAGINCLCICSKAVIKSQVEKCDKKGSCIIFPNLAGGKVNIKIKQPTVLTILKHEGNIFIGEAF
ncbi:MAG TPA: hypothetical protein PK357_00125 [Candidatus Pacearchaeota archaeon]|nr:hypothetical protein [Candidatus Pacearchaeota archaeon]